MYRLCLRKNDFHFLIFVQNTLLFVNVKKLTVGHCGSFLQRQKIDGWGIRVGNSNQNKIFIFIKKNFQA